MGKTRQIYCFGKWSVFRFRFSLSGQEFIHLEIWRGRCLGGNKIDLSPFPSQESVLLMRFLYKSLLASNQPETLIFPPPPSSSGTLPLLSIHGQSEFMPPLTLLWQMGNILPSTDVINSHSSYVTLSHEISLKPQFGCFEMCKKKLKNWRVCVCVRARIKLHTLLILWVFKWRLQ